MGDRNRDLYVEDMITSLDEDGSRTGEVTVNVSVVGEMATVSVECLNGDALAVDPFVAGPEQDLPLLSDLEKKRAVAMAEGSLDHIEGMNVLHGKPDDSITYNRETLPTSIQSDEIDTSEPDPGEQTEWERTQPVQEEQEDTKPNDDPFSQGGS